MAIAAGIWDEAHNAYEFRRAIGVHHSATSDGAWDGPAAEARLRDDENASYYSRAFAWRDVEEDGDKKAHYRFIHHEVGADGDIGAANMKACSSGIGVLNGGRGGTTVPASDKQGIHRHLAAHMMDGDMEPPEMMSFRTEGMERRSYPHMDLRLEGDGAEGSKRLSWYAAVFDSLSEDLGGWRERVGRRAFTKTIAEHDIRALFNHDPNLVLGRNKSGTLSMNVDLRGLHAEVILPDTQYARDLQQMIERGDVSGGSIGFVTLRDSWAIEEDVAVRTVHEVRLFDVSPVTFPAYPMTDGAAVRSLLDALGIDPIERLREVLTPRSEEEAKHAGIPTDVLRRRLELSRIRH